MGLRIVLLIIMLAFTLSQGVVFGVNDLYSLILVVISAAFMFSAIITIQNGNKKTLRVSAKKGSWLDKFLSKKNTPWIIIVSVFVSLFSAITLVVILKGIIINHGFIPSSIIIIVISLIISYSIDGNLTKSEVVSNNLQEDISDHVHNLFNLFMVAIVLNIVLSLLFSAFNTYTLLHSGLNMDNFDEYAANNQIQKSGSDNQYTRWLINWDILTDSIKLALTREVIEFLIPNVQDKQKYFYLFYITVFILNLIRLFAFSMSFVLLQKGFGGIFQIILNRSKKN